MGLRTLNISLDVIGLGAIVGAFAGYLPPFATLLAVLWYLTQLWESKLVQRWVVQYRLHRVTNLRRKVRNARRARNYLNTPNAS